MSNRTPGKTWQVFEGSPSSVPHDFHEKYRGYWMPGQNTCTLNIMILKIN